MKTKAIENQVDAAFRVHGQCVQINVMDVGKVLEAGRAAGRAGGDIDGAVKAAVEQYRQN